MEATTRIIAQAAVQDSHIVHDPSPSRDVAPSTSADRPPISIFHEGLPSMQFASSRSALYLLSQQRQQAPSEDDQDDDSASSRTSDEDARHPQSPPKSRRRHLPPIPDLRFEQSYLKQLQAAKGSIFWMIIITIREQVLLPGIQGFVWALGIAGIRTLRLQQAESGLAWGTWLRDYFGRLVRADTRTMGNRR